MDEPDAPDMHEGATKPRLPDLDQPPLVPPAERTLADRFAGVGPSSDVFPAVIAAVVIFSALLATTLGLVGQVVAALAVLTTWVFCVRIHCTPARRTWVYATEAAVVGLLLLIT